MSALPKSEIKAITKLLKSDDELESRLLKEQLETFDEGVLRDIESEIPPSDQKLKETFLKLVLNIRREKLKQDFAKWASDPLGTLEEGVFLVASFNNPFVDKDKYFNILEDWSKKLSENLKKVKLPNDSASIVNEINHFIFMDLGFRGNRKEYYDPNNSFIDKVIEEKLGNPILLSVIYILITNRLGLPVKGVNMPAHFLVQYTDSLDPIYVDPFNEGELITKTDCKERITALNLSWSESYLSNPTNKQIVSRIIQNLINIYHNKGEIELKELLEDYIKALKI